MQVQEKKLTVTNAEPTLKMHEEYNDIFPGILCIRDTFSYQLRMMQSHTRCQGATEVHRICGQGAFQVRTRKTPNTGTTRIGRNGQMTQLLHHSTQTQWYGMLMSGHWKAKPSIYKASITLTSNIK